MLSHENIMNPSIAEWLSDQTSELEVEMTFSQGIKRKIYTALPVEIQNFVSGSRYRSDQDTLSVDSRLPYSVEEEVVSVSSKAGKGDTNGISQKSAKVKEEKQSRSTVSDSQRNKRVVDNKFVPPRDIGGKTIKKRVLTSQNQPVQPLEDSNDLLTAADAEGLWSQFHTQGYVYLRNLLSKKEVLSARTHLVESLISMGHMSGNTHQALSKNGWTVDCASGTVIAGKQEFTDPDRVKGNAEEQRWKRVCSDPRIAQLPVHNAIAQALQLLSRGKALAEGEAVQPYVFHRDYSWLRVKGPTELTPEHADIFYLRVSGC